MGEREDSLVEGVLLDWQDNAACLDLKEQRAAVETLAYLGLKEILESKEKEDNRELLDHLDPLVKPVALEIQDHLDLLVKQEQLEWWVKLAHLDPKGCKDSLDLQEFQE